MEPAVGERSSTARVPSSHHLTAAIARGDERAFDAFYELWFDRAYALARSLTRRDEAFCLDVVQDSMLRVVGAMRPLRDEGAVAAWMAKTVFRVAVDHLRAEQRRRRRERVVAARTPDADCATPGDLLADAERQSWLRDRLAELPAADQRLVRERFVQGRTLQAAGAAVGITGHAAHGRLWRILTRLREAAKEWLDEP